jgi:plasmid stabilization system protein ParE
MTALNVVKADEFKADFVKYFGWYVREAEEAVAWRFQVAMEEALHRIARLPDLGSRFRSRDPSLSEVRSYRVAVPEDSDFLPRRKSDAPGVASDARLP